jgi:hypothetical protein
LTLNRNEVTIEHHKSTFAIGSFSVKGIIRILPLGRAVERIEMVEQVRDNRGSGEQRGNDRAAEDRIYLGPFSPKLDRVLRDALSYAERRENRGLKPAAYDHAIRYLVNLLGQPDDSVRHNCKPGSKDRNELAGALNAIKGALLADVKQNDWPAGERGIPHQKNNALRSAFQDLFVTSPDRIAFVEELQHACLRIQDRQDWAATLSPPSNPAR